MSEYLPKEVREGLAGAAEPQVTIKRRLKVKAGGHSFTILREWDTGFSVDAAEAPRMRGLVEVYDGQTLVRQGLVMATEESSGQMCYEYKRTSRSLDGPALDYEIVDPDMIIQTT